ncbi:MAG: metallophosphoesterase [Planctomycetes bacterium]|nr:metallophosphoesterase [Planctomycetota bacterium]
MTARALVTITALCLAAAPLLAQGRPGRRPLTIPEVTRDRVICFTLYTVHAGVLKLTAQLYPLRAGEDRTVRLEVWRDRAWQQIATAPVVDPGTAATFRVAGWDERADTRYRVAHGTTAFYEGRIRRNPIDKREIVVAAFSCNSILPAHGGDLAKSDLVRNVKAIDADLLFFAGDQVYDHRRHTAAWLKFGRDFGEITRDRPTITIPDDHDVGQSNLWGASGKQSKLESGADGGYFRPVEYVKMVERVQTSHLPDPFDPTPVLRGIGVYYTQLNWGRISFAILEDRKWKTGPKGLVPQRGPRPDHITDPDYDPKSIDLPRAVLLGERQLKFLDVWGRDWHGADFKVALSQTIFCGGAHVHGNLKGRLQADLDSNGWPQTGRNKAVRALRKCFALHIAGDQHLATLFHHGVDTWRDSGWSFCTPAIANLYLRWWQPSTPGRNRAPGMDPMLGDHLDGFGNHVTCWAAANPDIAPRAARSAGKLTTRAAGFGVVRFDKRQRTITMECWPRNVDVTDKAAKQYPGWPRTIAQTDNYARPAVAHLPTLEIGGSPDPVVQVIDEANGAWVYALRIRGNKFQPPVFHNGTYTIVVGEAPKQRTLRGVRAERLNEPAVLRVDL